MHEPCAHDARFERYIDRAVGEAPGIECFCGSKQSAELCVPCRIAIGLACVVGASDHFAVAYHDCPDRYFTCFFSKTSFSECEAHVVLVVSLGYFHYYVLS